MDLLDQSHYAKPASYDLVYSAYRDDLDFYVAAAREAQGPVLEVGCGTGRILLPTAQAGVDIDGLDIRPEMLATLQRKAEAAGLLVRVRQADMRDFTMPRRYALITIPFRAFMHNLTTEDQLRTLRCCRENLESGGLLLLNVFHPTFDKLVQPDGVPTIEKEFPHPETGLPVVVTSTRTTDRVNQILRCAIEVQESDARGYAARAERYEFTLRWTYKAEMELLLRIGGFSRWQVWGGFDRRPLERDTDEMVWSAWRD